MVVDKNGVDKTVWNTRLVKRGIFSNGSRKYLIALPDDRRVETTVTRDGGYTAINISTQVGCPVGCTFCSTGLQGLVRSLTSDEIAVQALLVASELLADQERASRSHLCVTTRGQGEPALNLDATLDALQILLQAGSLDLDPEHITLSTCGFGNSIARLGDRPEPYTLEVTLHSAVQATRDRLMPGTAGQPLSVLKDSLTAYADKGGKVQIVFSLIHDVNDEADELDALIGFCSNKPFQVLLGIMGSSDGSTPTPETSLRLDTFAKALCEADIPCVRLPNKAVMMREIRYYKHDGLA